MVIDYANDVYCRLIDVKKKRWWHSQIFMETFFRKLFGNVYAKHVDASSGECI